jgi:hypothetical protein
MHDQANHSNNEEQMNQRSGDVEYHESAHPQYEQKKSQHQQRSEPHIPSGELSYGISDFSSGLPARVTPEAPRLHQSLVSDIGMVSTLPINSLLRQEEA